MIVASQLSQFFLDINYILRSFTLSAEFAIVALVLTMVIISGEIDLSPAANMALSACLFACAQQAGLPMPVAIAVGLALGPRHGRAQRHHGDRPATALDHRHDRHADALSRPGAGDRRRQVDPGAGMVHRHQQRLHRRHSRSGHHLRRAGDRPRPRAWHDHIRPADLSGRHQRGRGAPCRRPLGAHQDDPLPADGPDGLVRRHDDGFAPRLGALRPRPWRRIADGADGDARRHLHLRRPRHDPRHLPGGLAAGHRHHRHDRRQRAAACAALRARRAAHRRRSSLPISSIPAPRGSGLQRRAAPAINLGGRTC